MNKKRVMTWLLGTLIVAGVSGPLWAQPGPQGKGPQGKAAQGKGSQGKAAQEKGTSGKGGEIGQNAAPKSDMELIRFLLDHRKEIKRSVKNLPNGVVTVTESTNPQVVAVLQTHVASMKKRVEEARPIHARDPLFAEIFRNTTKIEMQVEKTAKGVKVLETSDDAYTVKLIQMHAAVVSLFVQNGQSEAKKNHPVPKKN